MTEKVIFEYRCEESEDGGYTYQVQQGEERYIYMGEHQPSACWPMFGHWRSASRRTRRRREHSRRHMRATLDFLEEMYDDIYGESE